LIVLSVFQLGTGADVRSSPKAMAKLKKEVRKTKEVLSANSEAPISVEALYDDRDFRLAPCHWVLPCWDRAVAVAKSADFKKVEGAIWEAT
jgi:hypothetical protein